MRRLRSWLVCCLLLPAAAAAAPADPDWTVAQAGLCEAAIAAAETKYELPHGLLGSIAKAESGRPITAMRDVRAWPWTIDADGARPVPGQQGRRRRLGAQAQTHRVSTSSSTSAACRWTCRCTPARSARWTRRSTPAANADYAARYLRSLGVEAHGDWNVAVGLYHSHTPDLAAQYRNRVAAVGAGIITGIGGPEPLYSRALRARARCTWPWRAAGC